MYVEQAPALVATKAKHAKFYVPPKINAPKILYNKYI